MKTEWMSFICQSISTAVMNLFIFLFFKNIYGCKLKKRFYVLSYWCAVILMIAVNTIGIPFINLTYSFISLNILCILLFQSDVKKNMGAQFIFLVSFCFD